MNRQSQAPRARIVPVVWLSTVSVGTVMLFGSVELIQWYFDLRTEDILSVGIFAAFVFPAIVMCIGVGRHSEYQPLTKPEQLQWLRLSAWEPDQPLPFGPYRLVWRDLITLIWLALIGVGWGFCFIHFAMDTAIDSAVAATLERWGDIQAAMLIGMLASVGLYALGYLGSLAFHQAYSWRVWALGFMAPLVWPAMTWPALLPVWAIAIYILILPGVHQRLIRETERDTLRPPPDPLEGIAISMFSGAPARVGPDSRETPAKAKWREPGQALARAVVYGLLAAWWAWVILLPLSSFLVEMRDALGRDTPAVTEEARLTVKGLCLTVALAAGALLALGRLFRYLMNSAMPISLWGRVVHRRLIVTRFDIVFVVPLLIVVLPWVLFKLWQPQGLYLLVYLGVSWGLSIALAVGPWPTLDWWRHCSDRVVRLPKPGQRLLDSGKRDTKDIRVKIDFSR
ncbi:MAG: hypothetical protein AAF797_10255 [Planctomycetota bacterium]